MAELPGQKIASGQPLPTLLKSVNFSSRPALLALELSVVTAIGMFG